MMQVRKGVLCAAALIASVLLPTVQLAAEELFISGEITTNGQKVKGLPVVIQNETGSWILSTNSEGAFSAVIPWKTLEYGKYEVFVPNVSKSIGAFRVIPESSPWYAPWEKDGYRVAVDEDSVGPSAKLESVIEIKGFGDVNSLELNLDVFSK